MALDLGKQIGPLPLGAWVAVVAGGVGIAWYTRKGGAGDTTDDTTDQIDTSGVPGVGDGSVGGWVSTTPPNASGDDGSVAPDTKPTTNEAWGQLVINGLIALGYSPTLVDSAVRKYLAAEQLSVSEFTIIGLALAKYGSPPIPLPPSGQNPPTTNPTNPPPPKSTPPPVKPAPKPPAPKPAPKPKVRYYTVKSGDNLWNIAKKYYGNGALYGRIYNANRKGVRRADGSTGMIVKPSLIYAGWKLIIP